MSDELDEKTLRFHAWLTAMPDFINAFLSILPQDMRDKLDYSPQSLDILSDWILKTYPNEATLLAKENLKIADGIACYIGQTFRKNLGGFWNVEYTNVGSPVPIITGFSKNIPPIAPHSLLATLVREKRDRQYLQVILTFAMSKTR